MSSEKGLLLTCERCGNQIFLKTIGDGEMDGGFTRWNKFEKCPDGWVNRLGCDLCPDCFEQFEQIISDFMDGDQK